MRGFTLLEVMVALAIFSMISVSCYQLLASLNQSRSALMASSDFRARLEKALLIMEQDIRHVLPRSVRMEGQDNRLGALSTRREHSLELSRGGLPLRRSAWRDGTGRVVYQIDKSGEEAVLYRLVYPVLDRLEASAHYRQALLPGIAALKFRFMRRGGHWVAEWPPQGRDREANERNLKAIPSAIEITIGLPDERKIVRVISLR